MPFSEWLFLYAAVINLPSAYQSASEVVDFGTKSLCLFLTQLWIRLCAKLIRRSQVYLNVVVHSELNSYNASNVNLMCVI